MSKSTSTSLPKHSALKREGAFSKLGQPSTKLTAVKTTGGYVLRSPFLGELAQASAFEERSEREFFAGGPRGYPLLNKSQNYKLRFKAPRGPGYRQTLPPSPSPLQGFSPEILLPETVKPSFFSKRRLDTSELGESLSSMEKRARLEESESFSPVCSEHNEKAVCLSDQDQPIGTVGDTTERTYILGPKIGGKVRLSELRAPGPSEPVAFNPCGDAFENRVLRIEEDGRYKTFHSLNVFTDVNINEIDTKTPTYNDLAPRVMGWGTTGDSGITVSEFENFCERCKHCKRYSSSRTMRLYHICPSTDDTESRSANRELSPLSSSQVQALYNRFHPIHNSSGITLEELEYLFVVCWKCDRIMVRTAGLDHRDLTGHESSPITREIAGFGL